MLFSFGLSVCQFVSFANISFAFACDTAGCGSVLVLADEEVIHLLRCVAVFRFASAGTPSPVTCRLVLHCYLLCDGYRSYQSQP